MALPRRYWRPLIHLEDRTAIAPADSALDANGRRCSCGCAKVADAQPAVRLDAANTACTDGKAGPYPLTSTSCISPAWRDWAGAGNHIWDYSIRLHWLARVAAWPLDRTAFVDISNPSQPVYVGNLPTRTTASSWRGIKVFANAALSPPARISPRHAGRRPHAASRCHCPAGDPLEDGHDAGFGLTHTLAINSRTVFVRRRHANV